MDVKLYGDKAGGDGRNDGRKSTKNLTSLQSLEKDFDMPKFGRDNTGSSASFKTTRNSTHMPGAGGALRPPTSLKTPTAASYSSLSSQFKSSKNN